MTEERPYWESEDAFKEAVARAARRLRRWPLVVITAIATFVVATAVNIPVSEIISHDNARVNCELVTELAGLGAAHVGKERAALGAAKKRTAAAKKRTAEFKRESPDRLGLTPAQFDKLIAEQEAEQDAQVAEQAEETVEQTHRQNVLDHVASHACG